MNNRITTICLILAALALPVLASSPNDTTGLLEQGVELYKHKQFKEARSNFNRVLELAERKKDIANQQIAKYNLALVAEATNNFVESEQLLKNLSLNGSGIDRFSVMNELSSIYVKEKKDQQAEQLEREILATCPEVQKDPVLAAKVNVNLAAALKRLGRTADAVQKYNAAMTLLSPLTGPRADTVREQLLSNLGLLHLSQNRLLEAEQCERTALDLSKELYGLNDYRTSIALNNLAGVLKAQNKLTEAESLFQQAAAIKKQK